MEDLNLAPEVSLQPALDIIRKYEGCVLHAYPDPASGGEPWTIGWGHTGSVRPGQVITQEQADILLGLDVSKFAHGVRELCSVPLSQGELCALVSFSFNEGLGIGSTTKGLKNSSLLRKLNAGYPKVEVAAEFGKWIYAGGRVFRGLVRRRRDEAHLFLSSQPPTV